MDTVTIVAQRRSETGKGPARRLRRAGKLPVVLYGDGDSAALTIETKELQTLRQSESGANTIIDLSIEGGEPETCNAILRALQIDPVSRAMLHADFGRVSLDELITVSVQLEFVNVPEDRFRLERAELTVMMYELSIECLPRTIPNVIPVDLSSFEVGETLHAGDIVLPEGVSLVGNEDDTVVTALIPSGLEQEEAEEAAEAAEAGEVEAAAEGGAEAAADDGPSEPAPAS
jgi:large subunit ribosomal protein L25